MALAASQKHRWISILAADFLVFGNEDKAIICKKYQEVKQIILTKHDSFCTQSSVCERESAAQLFSIISAA